MRERVGEDFSAMILSATKYGLFVELDDLFVEGLVPLQSLGALDNDYYTYRENTREIIGERWGRRFRIGQKVRVLLDRVDAVQKRLQFSVLLDEEQDGESLALGAPGAGKARGPKPAKGKRKKGEASSVPAFAANVAKPGKKKFRGKREKASMQRQEPKPHPFPKKSKKGKRRK
jgi:ribonuclease R